QELPRRRGDDVPDGDALLAQRGRDPPVDQDLDRGGHFAASERYVGGAAQQRELVGVVVQDGAEVVQAVRAVGTGDRLCHAVGEGVGVAGALPLDHLDGVLGGGGVQRSEERRGGGEGGAAQGAGGEQENERRGK